MKIILSQNAYLKLKYYAQGCDKEISGLGESEYIDQKTIKITDIFLFSQEVSGASTDLDKNEVAKFLIAQHKQGKDTSKYNVWWHSHCNMGVFWSGTDNDTIENAFMSDNYVVSIEINHALQFIARVDLFKPFRITIDATPEIEYSENTQLQKKINKEIEDKVKTNYALAGTQNTEEIGKYEKKWQRLEQLECMEYDNLSASEQRELEALEEELYGYQQNRYRLTSDVPTDNQLSL